MVALEVETWLWFSLCLIIAIGRYYSRYETLKSIKSFCADDWLMLVILCFDLTLIVTINIVAKSSTNLLPRGFDPSTLTPSEVNDRIFGSKLVLVVEQCQCVVIWGVKTCLVIMYLRLTNLRYEHFAIKALAVYIGITFAVMEILYLGVWCRPISNYWAVPTPNKQCNAATNHLITNAVFNLTSDIIMLIVALPMFYKLRIPWNKKAPIIMIFSLGAFVIIAAVLNKVYSFSQPFGSAWTYWYVRESSTALLVCNLPFCWIYVRKTFKLLRIPFTSGFEDTQTNGNTSMVTRSVNRFGIKKRKPSIIGELGNGRHSLHNTNTNDANIELGTRKGSTTTGPGGTEMSMNDALGEDQNTIAAPETAITEITHPRLFRQRQLEQAASSAKPASRTEAEAIEADDKRMRASFIMDDTNARSMRRGSSVPESALGSSSNNSRRTSASWHLLEAHGSKVWWQEANRILVRGDGTVKAAAGMV